MARPKKGTHEPATTGTKICTRCQHELHVLCFSSDRRKSDGLRSACRDCEREPRKHTPSYQSKLEDRIHKLEDLYDGFYNQRS